MGLLVEDTLSKNNIGFKIVLEGENLKIIFNRDFYLHKEAVETIEYFMFKIKDMKVTDSLIRQVNQWFKGYLGLCIDTGLLSTQYIVGFIQIKGETE